MTDADHIKALRLFELSRAEDAGKDFRLETWEHEHLQQCAECRRVVDVFARQFKGASLPLPKRDTAPTASQRFGVGDHVKIVGPDQRREKRGVVTAVAKPKTGDFVYRYRVAFLDGGSDTFFGFELELAS
jgi:hypothetical protein